MEDHVFDPAIKGRPRKKPQSEESRKKPYVTAAMTPRLIAKIDRSRRWEATQESHPTGEVISRSEFIRDAVIRRVQELEQLMGNEEEQLMGNEEEQ